MYVFANLSLVRSPKKGLTTSFATRSQKDNKTRAEGGNTLAAVSASRRNASSTCEMNASIGVKSNCFTVTPCGVCTFLASSAQNLVCGSLRRRTRYSPMSPTLKSHRILLVSQPTHGHIPIAPAFHCLLPIRSNLPRRRFSYPRGGAYYPPSRMPPGKSNQTDQTQPIVPV
jgi:hypothetical protein